MSATPTDARPTTTGPTQDGAGVTFGRVLAAEWVKFRSLRSTVWTLSVTVVVMVGIAVLASWGTSTFPNDPGMDPTGIPGASGTSAGLAMLAIAGYFMAQLVVAVLGVLAITGEYTTGMIRSTLAAVPRRTPALWAKAVVVLVVVGLASLLAVALSVVATMPFHSAIGGELDLTDGQTLRILLGAPLYLAAIALLGFAIGALMRHSAGAIATVVGLLLVVETVFASIPLAFFQNVSPFLPSTAGSRLLVDEEMLSFLDQMSDGVQFSPWQGFGVLLAWVVVLLVAAAVMLRRRDA